MDRTSSMYVIFYCYDDEEHEKRWRIFLMGESHYANRLSPCSDFFTTFEKSFAVAPTEIRPSTQGVSLASYREISIG